MLLEEEGGAERGLMSNVALVSPTIVRAKLCEFGSHPPDADMMIGTAEPLVS